MLVAVAARGRRLRELRAALAAAKAFVPDQQGQADRRRLSAARRSTRTLDAGVEDALDGSRKGRKHRRSPTGSSPARGRASRRSSVLGRDCPWVAVSRRGRCHASRATSARQDSSIRVRRDGLGRPLPSRDARRRIGSKRSVRHDHRQPSRLAAGPTRIWAGATVQRADVARCCRADLAGDEQRQAPRPHRRLPMLGGEGGCKDSDCRRVSQPRPTS